ncbi:MAG: class I SAM-dependent methyltransferase [Erysipelotrichaceae bacterium]
MNHYFTDNRHLEQNRKEISFRFWCFNYSFVTDNGVFAKSGIDYGTKVLMETIIDAGLGKDVLDVGCGYGTIGVILGKILPESRFEMVDVNPRALELAKINAEKNQVSATIFESYCFDSVERKDYSDIITNPPIRAGKQVIYQIFTDAYDHLTEDGHLWVVIRKQHGAESAIKKISEVFGNCMVCTKSKGFFVLKATKKLDK